MLREKNRNVINKHNKYFKYYRDNSAYIRNILLIDVVFRVKEISRTINLYISSLNDLFNPSQKTYKFTGDDFKKFCCNDLVGPNYYPFHASIKMYSVYEKLAKFILCKHDIDKEYTKLQATYILNTLFQEQFYHYFSNLNILVSDNDSPCF